MQGGSFFPKPGGSITRNRAFERARTSLLLPSVVKRVRFGFDDHRIRALCGWVQNLWIVGKADEARSAIPRVVRAAEQFKHPIALAESLASVTSVWLWSGDRHAADEYLGRLNAHAEQHSLGVYRLVGRVLQGQLAVERGDAGAGLEALQEAIDSLQLCGFKCLLDVLAQPLALSLAQLGRLDEALAAIERALEANEGDGRSFRLAELLRVKGSLLAEHVPGRQSEAVALLRQSFERAHQQGALAWELRAATSLARHNRRGAPSKSAHALLKQTYSQFSQGFDTRDLILARQMLEDSAQ
jgi:tetratricopeptide (TPR) repeat protein